MIIFYVSHMADIIAKHQKISEDLDKWIDIRNYLIDQFHKQKGTLTQTDKYKFSDPMVERHYIAYLFANKNIVGGLYDFSCIFKCYMEKVLYQEHPKPIPPHPTLTYVYYHDHHISSFNKAEWSIDNSKNMTTADIATLNKFRVGLLNFLDSCLTLIQESGLPKEQYTDCLECRHQLAKNMIV